MSSENFNIRRYLTISPESGPIDEYVVSNITPFTYQGIPFLWGSGDLSQDIDASTELKITPSDGAADDRFGFQVSVGCGKIVATSPFDNIYTGAAYVYDLDGSNETKITASDGAVADFFGESLATGCGKIVVGSQYKDVGSNTQQGQVYIYDVDGSNEIKLTASDGGGMDHFGNSVAVGCGKIVVAAVGKNITATNSFGQTNTYYNTGGFYIYDLDGTNEIIVDDPFPSNGYYTDNRDFAYKVAIGCGRIVVSDPKKQLSNVGSAGAGQGNKDDVGIVYVFDLQGNLIGQLTPHALEVNSNSDGENFAFGSSLAIGDGLIVVGIPGWATGSNYDDGAIHVFDIDLNPLFRRTSSVWSQHGVSVAVGSGRIVTGASGHAMYIDAAGQGSLLPFPNATYTPKVGRVFYTLENIYSDLGISASDMAGYDYFGSSVDIGNGKLVVGSPQDDDNGNVSGSIYVYDIGQVYSLYDLIDMEYGD